MKAYEDHLRREGKPANVSIVVIVVLFCHSK
jgi:hypothetical protein